MTDKSNVHELITWSKQRLNELDTTITVVEKHTETLKDNARLEADRAVARLQQARAKLREYTDNLHTEVDVTKQRASEIKAAIETEWVEAESAFYAFLSAVRDQADSVQDIIRTRARAQRQSWEVSMKNFRSQTTTAVEKARSELDTAMQHLSNEADKFQSRISEVKDAGDESWKAVKEGLSAAKDIHDRTIQKIKEALLKPH